MTGTADVWHVMVCTTRATLGQLRGYGSARRIEQTSDQTNVILATFPSPDVSS